MTFSKFVWIVCMLILILAFQRLEGQTTDHLEDQDAFFLAKKPGLLGKLGKGLEIKRIPEDTVIKIDQGFGEYLGYNIRDIYVRELPFGISIHDTSSAIKNFLVKMANKLHLQTKEQTIRNNLFFKAGDPVFPALIADNERHLREQFYLQDCRIELVPDSSCSAVDVYILTKDIIAHGANLKVHAANRLETEVYDENNFGRGNRLGVRFLYDLNRKPKAGLGVFYDFRNIKGTFLDLSVGLQNAKTSISDGLNQEKEIYLNLSKPLVSPYFPLTYALNCSFRQTSNRYLPDSAYAQQSRYAYFTMDAWAAYNLGANQFTKTKRTEQRLRKYLSARFLRQKFFEVPQKFDDTYNILYADLSAVLGAFTVSKQEFYKTRYVYGFGRNEDLPEGFAASFITGFTDKAARSRAYFAVDLQRDYLSRRENYFAYNFKFGAFLHERGLEDLSWLFGVDYFSKLKKISPSWTRRWFASASFTRLNNIVLLDPLYLNSSFGLPEFTNPSQVARIRATLKAELVLFNNWSFYGFKFAPIASGSLSLLTPYLQDFYKSDGYSSISLGIRSRNENLVFGTMELRAYFFPKKNQDMSSFKLDFKTNLRYKYNSQLIKRPEFIMVN